MKRWRYYLCLVLEWGLICVGVFGSLYSLTTAFGLPMPPAVKLLVPLLSLLLCLLLHGKAGKYYALGVLGLLLLTGLLFRKEVIEGLRSLWGTLAPLYAKGYDFFWDLLPREPTEPEHIGPGLIALAALQTFLCTLSVRLWRRSAPVALALLLGVVPCFILIDTPPAILPLLSAVFVVLTLAFSQSARRRGLVELLKSLGLAALLSAALLGLLLLLFPQKTYSQPFTWDELSQRMARWEEQRNNRGNARAGLSGNPDQIELRSLGSLPNRSIPALYITSSTDAYVYLRGSSYQGFDGQRWTHGSLWNGGKKALFPYLDAQTSQVTELTLQVLNPEPILYSAYQLVSLPGGRVFGDAYIENTEELTNYTLRCAPDPDPIEPDRDYDAWVRSHCLDVPEQTRAGLLAWWEQITAEQTQEGTSDGGSFSFDPADPVSTERFARLAAERVSQTANYSRTPLRVPSNQDFCTWFVNEAEEGYCVHYATVCAALLRSLGIPARYVSGYVCALSAGQRTAVTNLQAHAWVEIWSGGRWVVVESTPDYATEFVGASGPASPAQTAEPTTEPTTEPPPPPPSESLTDPPPISKPGHRETTGTPEAGFPEVGDTDDPGPGYTFEPEKKLNLDALWFFLGVIGFVSLVLLRRALANWVRKLRLRRAKGNAKARLLYRYLERLHRIGGNPIPEEARALGCKAAFSQHELSDEEIDRLRRFYVRQCYMLRCYSVWRRLWCSYVLAVI